MVEPYRLDQDGVDITSQASIQMRGINMEDSPTIDGLHTQNWNSFQSALSAVPVLLPSVARSAENTLECYPCVVAPCLITLHVRTPLARR